MIENYDVELAGKIVLNARKGSFRLLQIFCESLCGNARVYRTRARQTHVM